MDIDIDNKRAISSAEGSASVLPSTHKRLVICCDGTWNHLEMAQLTNVALIAMHIPVRGSDGVLQLTYYDEGIGTSGSNWLSRTIESYVGGGMGFGLANNVKQAYRFLVNNYEQGDEIYLFGFSRGAYTVRALTGMLHFAGLLGRHQLSEIEEAYQAYHHSKDPNCCDAQQFRQKHQTRKPSVTLLGCWDTVGALGIPDKSSRLEWDKGLRDKFRFLDDQLSPYVVHARHAVAIDERRKEFTPTLMRRHSRVPQQDLKQVWFVGDHGCIGGGATYKYALSSIALDWLATEAMALGLCIDAEFIDRTRAAHNGLAATKVEKQQLLYQYQSREIPQHAVFHQSVAHRIANVTSYRQRLGSLADKVLRQWSVTPTVTDPNSPRHLAIDESTLALVKGRELPNNLGISVEAKEVYQLSVSPYDYWQDDNIMCTAKGWNLDSSEAKAGLSTWLRPIQSAIIKRAKPGRLAQEFDWMALMIGFDPQVSRHCRHFHVTPDQPCTVTIPDDHTGSVFAYANDYKTQRFDFYGNNQGWLVVTVKRVS